MTLDSTISSNSQELFDFDAEHNGEACIESLNPEDTRENKFWFTVADGLIAIYNESDKTIRNNIEELAQEGELGDCKIFQRRINIEDSCGVLRQKRACDRAWLSAKQVENWSRMSTTTLWRWLEKLEKARRISRFSDLINVEMARSS